MARQQIWEFSPSEKRDLAVSMASELDSGASMTGQTPTVNAWTKDSTGAYSAASGFTFANVAVNTAQLTAEDGEIIAIGDGIQFRCTATTVLGDYYILSQCAGDDGTLVKRFDKLVVSGPGP